MFNYMPIESKNVYAHLFVHSGRNKSENIANETHINQQHLFGRNILFENTMYQSRELLQRQYKQVEKLPN